MALEFDLSVSSVFGYTELFDAVVRHASAVELSAFSARRDGLLLTGRVIAESDARELDGRLLGNGPLPEVTFRFSNLAAPEVAHSNEIAMLTATVTVLTSRHDAAGLLKANGEYLVAARMPGEPLTFGHDWRGHFGDDPDGRLTGLSQRFPVRTLPQPFM